MAKFTVYDTGFYYVVAPEMGAEVPTVMVHGASDGRIFRYPNWTARDIRNAKRRAWYCAKKLNKKR